MKIYETILIIICILKITKEKFKNRNFTILKYDKDFIKPKIKLNAEFELIKMQNGMKGILIHDPFTTYYHVHLIQIMEVVSIHIQDYLIYMSIWLYLAQKITINLTIF